METKPNNSQMILEIRRTRTTRTGTVRAIFEVEERLRLPDEPNVLLDSYAKNIGEYGNSALAHLLLPLKLHRQLQNLGIETIPALGIASTYPQFETLFSSQHKKVILKAINQWYKLPERTVTGN